MPAATASGADAKANGAAKSRDHNQGNQDRKYTLEQKVAVIRVRKCSPTAFYDILGLEEVKTTVTETEIKKAYRKLSLLTHPDKNGHEHADEAFKMVSRAFGVLSDADKKKQFDRYGGDPDSRSGGGSAPSQSPFSGFGGRSAGPSRGGGGPMWDDEVTPEEMFNRFFGGGGMGGGFGPFGMFDFDFGFGQSTFFEDHDCWFAETRQEHEDMRFQDFC
jgi:DnaJ family protein B protein 12